MKVLSVKQPWASLIMEYGKDVDNRSVITRYRGPLAIHASQSPAPTREWDYIMDTVIFAIPSKTKQIYRRLTAKPYGFVCGAILGIVDLVDCLDEYADCESKWAEDLSCLFMLKNPRVLKEPIPALGRLGLWDPSPAVMSALTKRGNFRTL
jgi:hypothetical protein